MSKTATAKTNGHSVDAIRAVAHKAGPRPATKASLAGVAPARASRSGAAKPGAKAPAKPAKAKSAAKAAPEAPAGKTATPKAAVKKAAAAKKTAPKAAPAAAPKAAAKRAAGSRPKAGAAQAEAEREKMRKPKLVRDSFTMPEQEYAVLAQVKKACLKAGFEIKKSELLRIGVALINQIDTATLKSILAGLPQLKTGRPKSS